MFEFDSVSHRPFQVSFRQAMQLKIIGITQNTMLNCIITRKQCIKTMKINEVTERERRRTLNMKGYIEQQMKQGTAEPKEKLYSMTLTTIISITLTLTIIQSTTEN